MCGLVDSQFDDFDWKRSSGETGTMYTGPTVDHTTGKDYSYLQTRLVFLLTNQTYWVEHEAKHCPNECY